MFLHSGLKDNFTFLKSVLIELKIIIWLSKPFFNPIIVFKTSFACSDPKIPAGILGSLQANEVLKTIIGLKNGLDNQMMIFNSIKTDLRKVKLSFNPECKNKC